MRRMLISRISRRVLAEHHISLSEAYSGRGKVTDGEPHVGIIFTGLNVKRSVERCVRLLRETPQRAINSMESDGKPCLPEVEIDGHIDTSFAYIREHLEYDFYLIHFLSDKSF